MYSIPSLVKDPEQGTSLAKTYATAASESSVSHHPPPGSHLVQNWLSHISSNWGLPQKCMIGQAKVVCLCLCYNRYWISDLPLGKAGVIMCEFPQIQKQNSKVTDHKFNSCLPESACLKMSVLYLFLLRFWRQCSIELQILEIQNKSAFWCFLCNLSFLNTLMILCSLFSEISSKYGCLFLPVIVLDLNSSLLRIFLFHLYFFPLYFQFSLSGNIICWIWDLLGWSSSFLIFLLFSIFVLLFSKSSSNYF